MTFTSELDPDSLRSNCISVPNI